MKPRERLATAVGFACLSLALVLILPGVHVVQADGDTFVAADPGAMCEDPALVGPPAAPDPAAGPKVAAPELAAAAEAARGTLPELAPGQAMARIPGTEVMMLNGNGYNYGGGASPVAPPKALLELEARRGR